MSDEELKLGQTFNDDKKEVKDYKQLYGELRNKINNSVDAFRKSLAQTKDVIEQEEEKLKILKKRRERLEGAIEASTSFLTSVLPSNNKPRKNE